MGSGRFLWSRTGPRQGDAEALDSGPLLADLDHRHTVRSEDARGAGNEPADGGESVRAAGERDPGLVLLDFRGEPLDVALDDVRRVAHQKIESFAALEPTGTGLVRAFVTERPLDIAIPAGEDYASGGEELAARIGAALVSAAGQLEGAVLLDTWGTASVVYEIHD